MLEKQLIDQIGREGGGSTIHKIRTHADVKMLAVVVIGGVMFLGGIGLMLYLLHELVLSYWGAGGVRTVSYILGGLILVGAVASVGYLFFYTSMNLSSSLMARVVLYMSIREMVDDRGEMGRTMAQAFKTLGGNHHDSVKLAQTIQAEARRLAAQRSAQNEFDFGDGVGGYLPQPNTIELPPRQAQQPYPAQRRQPVNSQVYTNGRNGHRNDLPSNWDDIDDII